MKIAVVGGGSIGLFAALQILQENKFSEITIYDHNSNDVGSASAAAGAMEAVFGEIESGYQDDAFQQRLVENGITARNAWDAIYDSFGLDCVTAKSTVVFLNKNANEFEAKNFSEMRRVGTEFCECVDVDPAKYFFGNSIKQKDSVVLLKSERAFDPRTLLERVVSYLKKSNVKFVKSEVKYISTHDCTVHCENTLPADITYDKVIVAAGPATGKLFEDINPMVPLLFGIGTAMLLEGVPFDESIRPELVYRSVNRGGSQCGLHLVPLKNGSAYVGAGNYLSWVPETQKRFETIRYLMNESEQDLLGPNGFYKAKGEILMGFRCRSFDYKPLLGPLQENPNIIVATGFNRVGLTMSPLIAQDVCAMMAGREATYFHSFLPQRQLIPSGDEASVCEDYSLITYANLVEHSLVNHEAEQMTRERLRAEGRMLNSKINERLKITNSFGHTPDALSVLARYGSNE